MKKFELTSEFILHNGRKLYRIKALKSYPFVEEKEDVNEKGYQKAFHQIIKSKRYERGPHVGDLGGFVQSENNLSQEGNCWIRDNALVYDNAKVIGNAQISNSAEVYGDSQISGNVTIYGHSEIGGDSKIDEAFWICKNDLTYNNIRIFGGAFLLNKNTNERFKNYSVSLVSGGSYTDIDSPLDAEIESYGMNNLKIVVNILEPDGWKTLMVYKKRTKTIIAGKFEGTIKDFLNYFNHKCKNKDDLEAIVKFLKNPPSKKYALTNETKVIDNAKLYRIKSLRPFSDIKKGSLGGFIEKEENLSHSEKCWIYDDANVYGNAKVSGDAKVYNRASISGNAEICDEAEVFGSARVWGNAKVFLNAKLFGNTKVYDNAKIYGKAHVFGEASVFENAKVHLDARVFSNTKVIGNASLAHDTYNSANQFITLGPLIDKLNHYHYVTFEKQSMMICIDNNPFTIDKVKDLYKDFFKAPDYLLIVEFYKILEEDNRKGET